MSFTFGPRRGLYVDLTEEMPGRRAAHAGRAGPLRDLRPPLSLALRPPLQLRPHVGPPRRVDLLGPPGRRGALRRDGLRARRPGPAGRRPHQLLGRPQGDGSLRHVGAARRGRGGGRPGPAARKPEAAPPPGGPPRLPPQPDHRDAAVPRVRRPGARRAPDAGDPVRQALHGRLRRRRRQLHRPGLRRRRPVRRRRPPRAHHRGRGRPDARPRERSARRGRHRLARQRRAAPRLEPGVDRLATTSAGRAFSPATTCSGTRESSSTCTTGT